jgi:hypothetical protein
MREAFTTKDTKITKESTKKELLLVKTHGGFVFITLCALCSLW